MNSQGDDSAFNVSPAGVHGSGSGVFRVGVNPEHGASVLSDVFLVEVQEPARVSAAGAGWIHGQRVQNHLSHSEKDEKAGKLGLAGDAGELEPFRISSGRFGMRASGKQKAENGVEHGFSAQNSQLPVARKPAYLLVSGG